MGTRAMVLRQQYMNGAYECYYRHLDGYPTGLGADLICALKSPVLGTWEELTKECRSRNMGGAN